ncbi:MAG: hypothetical protein M0R48_04740, partial [Candidatus Omnitrophica bacterium]|nr:hypothetical protein [Candidatus Omnitrophota bacterium]
MIAKRPHRLSNLNIFIRHLLSLRHGLRPGSGLPLAATICYLFFNGCVTTEYNVGTHRQDIMFYSTEKEIAMGQAIAKEVAKEMKISNNPHDIERVNKIGKKIVEVCDRKEISYYFYVITGDEKGDTEDKNAFSVPGGYIYIYK